MILFPAAHLKTISQKYNTSFIFEHGYTTVLYGLPRFSYQRCRVFGPATPLALAYRLLETMLREERRWESSERHSAPKKRTKREISNPSNRHLHLHRAVPTSPPALQLPGIHRRRLRRTRAGLCQYFHDPYHQNLCAPLFLSSPPHRLPTRP